MFVLRCREERKIGVMSISTEQLVGVVLGAAHERLQQRCNQPKIVALLEEKYGAYDVDAVRSLLKRRYEHIEQVCMVCE